MYSSVSFFFLSEHVDVHTSTRVITEMMGKNCLLNVDHCKTAEIFWSLCSYCVPVPLFKQSSNFYYNKYF